VAAAFAQQILGGEREVKGVCLYCEFFENAECSKADMKFEDCASFKRNRKVAGI